MGTEAAGSVSFAGLEPPEKIDPIRSSHLLSLVHKRRIGRDQHIFILVGDPKGHEGFF
jgi:hypothetical protein